MSPSFLRTRCYLYTLPPPPPASLQARLYSALCFYFITHAHSGAAAASLVNSVTVLVARQIYFRSVRMINRALIVWLG